MPGVTVVRYPWGSLDRVPRALLRRIGELRNHTTELVPEGLEGVLGALIGTQVVGRFDRFALGPPERRFSELTLAWGDNVVSIGAEPALVVALLERVLARPFALKREQLTLDATLLGAFAALAVEVVRRLAPEPVTLRNAFDVDATTLRADATFRFDGRAFAGYALLSLAPVVTAERPRIDLDALGDLALAIPVVVGASLASPAELRRLVAGSAFVPGEKLWVDARGVGRGVLASALGESGAPVELPTDGHLVLREGSVELAPDVADPGESMDEADDVNETLADAALEAPVVVRVEMGTVSMTAADWARLRPGDVIETGRRIAEPVVLRIAGRVVARGELCDVDGEVGVVVRELVGVKPER
jgi:flagellar motor switch/type III secretory pathway protein FliN